MDIGTVRQHRQHPVENPHSIEFAKHIIVGPGAQRAAAIILVIAFEHHRDMRLGRARIGAQPAAHLEPGEVVHDPVDEDPDRPFDQAARSIRPDALERKAIGAVDKVLARFAQLLREEDVDYGHAGKPLHFRQSGAVM